MKLKLFLYTILLAISYQVYASPIVGSNTSVSVQALTTFPTSDNVTPGNVMLGFAAFTSGFTLQNSSTICSYNDFFPVGSTVTMNSGTLNLLQSMPLASSATFVNGGNINGNNNALFLPNNVPAFSISGSTSMGNITMVLNSQLTLSSLLTFSNTSIVEGSNNVIDITNASAKLAVGPQSSVLIRNATINGVGAGKIFCTDNLSTFSFQNVTFILDTNYSFTQGSFEVMPGSQLIMTGTSVFVYQSTKPSIIHTEATLAFDSGMTFSYDTTSNSLLTFADNTAILQLNQTTLFANAIGLKLTVGQLNVNGLCPVFSNATSSATGILIGDNTSAANDLTLNVLAESGLYLKSGFLTYQNV